MVRNTFQFEYSPVWLIAIVLIAAGLSFWLYSKKGMPWSAGQNLLLASLRFFGVFLLLALLLEPTLQINHNTELPPTIHVLVDNSSSVGSRGPSANEILSRVETMQKELNDAGINTLRFSLNDSSSFSAPSSNLSAFLKETVSQQRDENQVASLLISDGIYNQGLSPAYRNYLKPVFTIGVGDTVPPQDISITRTLFNKVTYKGNQSPIRVEISQSGFQGKSVEVQITENGNVLSKKVVQLSSSIQEVDFQINQKNEGLKHLVVSVTGFPEESSAENNTANVFFEVIDGKRNVLIVANSPHPDIKAIRSSLNETGNYEAVLFSQYLDGEKPTENFDVIIYHGAFRARRSFVPKGNPGIWYILSNESSIRSVNSEIPYLQIDRKGSRPDKVTGSFNQNFSKFKIEETSAFEEFPPLEVPFGEYAISGPAEIVMFQKLGSFKTDKPLMVVYDDGSQKSAVLMGQNIWTWKMQEAAINGNSNQFSNLIRKTVQYLAVSNKQDPFLVVPTKRSFNETEPVVFQSEVYNDIYERIYGNKIQLEITSKTGDTRRFSFTDSEVSSSFRAPAMDPGIYQYAASVERGESTLIHSGEFSVQDINLEALNLTADHRLLRTLAAKSGGSFATLAGSEALIQELRDREFKTRIKSDEELQPVHELWWWYLTIFLLFSGEWLLRKYWGAY